MKEIRKSQIQNRSGTCNNCGIFFPQLAIHIGRGCQPRFCRICEIQFTYPYRYRNHLITIHGNANINTLICNLCHILISSRQNLRRHMQNIHNILITNEVVAQYVNCDMCNNRVHPDQVFQHVTDCHRQLCHENLKISLTDPVTCTVCKKTLAEATQYAVHVHSEHCRNSPESGPTPTFQCSRCLFNTKDSKQLDVHQIVHLTAGQIKLQPNPWKCRICGLLFTRIQETESHTAKCQLNLPHKCTICKLSFPIIQQLRKHLECISHKKKRDQELSQPPRKNPKWIFCDVCNCHILYTLTKPHALSVKHLQKLARLNRPHVRPRIDTSNVEVPSVGEEGHCLSELSGRIGQRSNDTCQDGSGTCNECGLFFNKIQIHKGKGCKPRFCQICKTQFSSPCIYRDHVNTVHKKNNRLICEICRQLEESPQFLKKHMQNRHNILITYEVLAQYVTCDLCCSKMNTEHLFQHVSDCHRQLCYGNHKLSPVDPVTCTTCNTSLTDGTQYAVHVHTKHCRIYSEPGPSPTLHCSQCSFTTMISQQLNIHLTAHLTVNQILKEPNPWKCTICGFVFSRIQDAEAHRSNCTTALPLLCVVCNVPFLSKGALIMHFSSERHAKKRDHELYHPSNDNTKRILCDVSNGHIVGNGKTHHEQTLGHRRSLDRLNRRQLSPTIDASDVELPVTTTENHCLNVLSVQTDQQSDDPCKDKQTTTESKQKQGAAVPKPSEPPPIVDTDAVQISIHPLSNNCYSCKRCSRQFTCPIYANIHKRMCKDI